MTAPIPLSPRPPRFLDQLADALRTRGYVAALRQGYVDWVRRYILFHKVQHRQNLGATEVAALLDQLGQRTDLSPAAEVEARAALIFLYDECAGCHECAGCQNVPGVTNVPGVRSLISRSEIRFLTAGVRLPLVVAFTLWMGVGWLVGGSVGMGAGAVLVGLWYAAAHPPPAPPGAFSPMRAADRDGIKDS